MTPSRAESEGASDLPARTDADVPAADPLLPGIRCAADVHGLDIPQLEQLAGEVRARIIEVIARTGGHFGAPLGAVDLTIALLHQLDPPGDRVVWDVGHQAYAWKILTGRNERFASIRQKGGLSGFLKRSESPCDAFGAGHASTSIAAALGMAEARDRLGQDHRVAAVIGDGAMTGGMAYEALNNAGLRKSRMLVVFNDNEMSISENVWVVQRMFRKAVTHPLYNRFRRDVVEAIKRHSSRSFIDFAHRLEESIKGVIVPGMFFEELGFRYIGPVNGHSMEAMVETLAKIKDLPGPICMHVITRKGKGYKFAEDDPVKYHAASNMKIETGEMQKKPGLPAYSAIFGRTLAELARADERIVAITAAMEEGTGLKDFAKEFPGRLVDVGIAEECAVTMAAGMAAEGLRPVCAIYSTFMQRAFDQAIHDAALQKLPVFFALDRAGLVGADGPTHHGTFDLAYLRLIPNMVVMAPKDEAEFRDMIATGIAHEGGPIAVRYPRGSGPGAACDHPPTPLKVGRAEILRRGDRVALVAIGSMVAPCLKAADLLEEILKKPVTVVNARFVKPLDRRLLVEVADGHELVVTVEENSLAGGFGSAVLELLAREGCQRRSLAIGIPDAFVEHGTPEELLEELGLTPEGVALRVLEALGIELAGSAEAPG